MKDNAWFVGFAPRQSPEIVVVTLFENGEHGDRAAPIVRDVIKAYFDKKNRTQQRTLITSAPPSLLHAPPPLNPPPVSQQPVDSVVAAIPVEGTVNTEKKAQQ